MPKIIAVSKTFGMDKILPLIDYGHLDFGENKVQEAIEKWSETKLSNNNINLIISNKKGGHFLKCPLFYISSKTFKIVFLSSILKWSVKFAYAESLFEIASLKALMKEILKLSGNSLKTLLPSM